VSDFRDPERHLDLGGCDERRPTRVAWLVAGAVVRVVFRSEQHSASVDVGVRLQSLEAVVHRTPCILVVEGKASVAPPDLAGSLRAICPHRTAMRQVRTASIPDPLPSFEYVVIGSAFLLVTCRFSRPELQEQVPPRSV
jgi:hypothetical protein